MHFPCCIKIKSCAKSHFDQVTFQQSIRFIILLFVSLLVLSENIIDMIIFIILDILRKSFPAAGFNKIHQLLAYIISLL